MACLQLEVHGLEAGGLRLADQLASTREQLEEAAMAHGALQARARTVHTCDARGEGARKPGHGRA